MACIAFENSLGGGGDLLASAKACVEGAAGAAEGGTAVSIRKPVPR